MSFGDVTDFSIFDKRNYRTVTVPDGYGKWQPTYDDTVHDLMDLELLERITTIRWEHASPVVDLGCGTGRTARWLDSKGAGVIDGVDLTPQMVQKARETGLYRHLEEADVRSTGLAAAAYDVAVCCLVDEHLSDLRELYGEAQRLLRPEGKFVVVGYHPFFLMASGMPTHFNDERGDPVAIETYVHLPSAHVGAARAAGFVGTEMHESVVEDEWIRRKPKWERYRGWPISFAWVWSRHRF